MIGRMGQLSTIVRTDLRRLARDRLALFFLAVLPFIVILALASFASDGDADARVAVVDQDGSAEAVELRRQLASQDGIKIEIANDERTARRDLQLDRVNGMLVIPAGYGNALMADGGEVTLVLDRARTTGPLVAGSVNAAVDRLGRRLAVTTLLADQRVVEPADRVQRVEADFRALEVSVEMLGTDNPGGSTLTFVAGGQLLLFMFVNTLAAGAALIEMRRLGIAHRILAGPVDAGDIITGVGLARLLVAVVFGGVVASLAVVVYGVDWGSLAVVVPIVVLFALVSTGAATLIGAVLDEPDAATSVGIPLGLAMAALGGCMFPIWLAPDPVQVASKVLTPHAWALDGLMAASFDGAGPVEVWPNFVVLSLWAAGLLVAGRTLARRRLRTA